MREINLTKQQVKDIVSKLYLKLGDGKKPLNLQTQLARDTFKKENFSFGIDIVRKEINRIYGSKHNLDIDLGLEPLHMELTLEEAEKIYEKVCKENGNKALSQLSLRKMGFGKIIGQINKHHVDKNELDKRLGFKPLCRNKPWTQKLIIKKYRKLYEKNGRHPLNGIQLKASGLITPIAQLFPSRNKFYKMAGLVKSDFDFYPINECWTRDKIIKRFKDLCLKHNDRPLFQTELRLLGESKLDSAIFKYFSSRQDLYSECGYSSDVLYLLSNGELARSTFEVYFANYLIHHEIDFKCDKIIDKTSGRDFKYDFLVKDIYGNYVYIEIWGYENTRYKDGRKGEYSQKRKLKEKFYKDRNLKLISINEDVFRSSFLAAFKIDELQQRFKEILIENSIKLDNFITLNSRDLFYFENNRLDILEEKYLKICQEKNGCNKPVSVSYLREIEEWGIIYAIQKYAGGKMAFDESLGFKNMKSKRFSFDEFVEEFNQICREQGDIPLGPAALRKMGQRGCYIVGLATDYNTTFRELNALCGRDWDPNAQKGGVRKEKTGSILKRKRS